MPTQDQHLCTKTSLILFWGGHLPYTSVFVIGLGGKLTCTAHMNKTIYAVVHHVSFLIGVRYIGDFNVIYGSQ